MACITFLTEATTTIAVTIPRWAPDIKWMQTTSAIVLEYPTTTMKASAGDMIVLRRPPVISWTNRTFTACFYASKSLTTTVHLKYRAVGELIR